MTYRERIDAIRVLGYTHREAGFLELVALQSGYFLRRQYNAFLDRKRGGTAAALIRKLVQRRHVSVEPSCDRTPIYRLGRRAFYDRIEEPNNRHRRRRGTVGIASKVMALDAILEMREVAWLGTEAEKRAFFEEELRIPSPFLPSRKPGGEQRSFRYFVDKIPIGFEPGDQSRPPVVSIIYADSGANPVSFERFLERNRLLFACLPRLQIVHASPSTSRLDAGHSVFEAFRRDLRTRRREIIEAKVNRFSRYFDLMRHLPRDASGAVAAWALPERNRLMSEIDPADLVRLMKFAAQPDRPDMRALARPKTASRPQYVCYRSLHLDHDYRLFGLLA